MDEVVNKSTLDLTRFFHSQFSKHISLKTKQANKFCSEACVNKNKGVVDGILQCNCGEDVGIYLWRWSTTDSSPGTGITNENKDILFHPCYSSGTALVRGDISFEPNLHYYWEVKITSNMYGTDMMIGVGTSKVQCAEWKLRFCSLLGIDSESWGYSYHGKIQHNNLIRKYGSKFGLGSIVGVHLDMCKGTLEYYLNRKPLGVAFTGLKVHELYPMVSSTAAQSAVRLVCAVSEEPTLQMLCLKFISKQKSLYKNYQNIPGLKRLYERKYFWIVPNFEEDSAKRLAEIEDNLMCPLTYKNFLKTNKKLRTTLWCSNDLYNLKENDSNLNVTTKSDTGDQDSSDYEEDISNLLNVSSHPSSCTSEKSQIDPSNMKLNMKKPPSTSRNCDESQNEVKTSSSINISNKK